MFFSQKYINQPSVGVQVNPTHPLAYGLLAYWLFNEGCGEKVHSLPRMHQGTLIGPTWVLEQTLGSALNFDGLDDYIRIPTFLTTGNSQTEITFGVWMKSDPNPTAGRMFCHWDENNQRSVIIANTGIDNKAHVLLSDNGQFAAGHNKWYISSIDVFDGELHFVAATFKAGILKIYIDGIEDTAITKSVDDPITTVHNSTADLTIGTALINDVATLFQTGILARPIVFNRTLNAMEMFNLYWQPYAVLIPGDFELRTLFGRLSRYHDLSGLGGQGQMTWNPLG
jgi:hypothetical protein